MSNINRILRAARIEPVDVLQAQIAWDDHRLLHGFQIGRPLCTQPSENHKLRKALHILGISLAHAQTSGVVNCCPFSTGVCRRGCNAYGGKGALANVQRARVLRTTFLLDHPSEFVTVWGAELDHAVYFYPADLRCRPNVYSDIRWEEAAPWLFEDRPSVRFYDYTKDWARKGLDNYRLVLSASERTSTEQIRRAVGAGRNVAVVFAVPPPEPLPSSWEGMSVIDGDKSDDRFRDPLGVIVGLRAKGRLRGDRSGFVRDV